LCSLLEARAADPHMGQASLRGLTVYGLVSAAWILGTVGESRGCFLVCASFALPANRAERTCIDSLMWMFWRVTARERCDRIRLLMGSAAVADHPGRYGHNVGFATACKVFWRVESDVTAGIDMRMGKPQLQPCKPPTFRHQLQSSYQTSSASPHTLPPGLRV
jgi:hypothetical protein